MADFFTLLINDTSPLLSYFPFPDTLSIPNFSLGWNPCFNLSACTTYHDEQGNGTSFHITSRDKAAFSIEWWGNGIQLFGFAEGPVTYDLLLDNVTTSSSISPSATTPTLLAAYDDLQPSAHTLSLIVHNPNNSSAALIAIDYALITVYSTNATFSTKVTEDTELPFTGQWSFLDDPSLSPLDTTYHTTTNAGDFVTFNFTGTAVTVFGFRDAESGPFSVQLDNDTVYLNGVSSAKEATTLFFRTGLNNSVPHTLKITNGGNSSLSIGSINVTTASSQSTIPISGSSSHKSRGAIAAIAIASILGALVFLIVGFFLWHRRRQFRRILHRKRLFVPPTGNDHSKVLDIVRGPEVDDFEDMYEDKGPVDKSRHGTNNGSGSLSFTLDLPIQSRPSLPHSQRDYSGNSAQELPRSPTVSLGRTGTHPRESSRGVPLQDIPLGDDGDDSDEHPTPPSLSQGQAADDGTRTGILSQDQDLASPTEARTFALTPVVAFPPLPRESAVASSPEQGGSDQSQQSYSFLDITASSQVSFASVRHPGIGASSSSSSSGSMRRRSEEPYSATRRISLPFAMGYHRGPLTSLPDRPGPSHLPTVSADVPRFSLNIRPLPRIPQSAVEPRIEPMLPTPPPRALRPHTQSTPPLFVHTEFDEPQQQLPRSVSVTTAPPTSALSGGRVPQIIIHPSSFMRARPRSSSVVSPTESVPVTVSDIHFRHSSDDEPGEPESRRASTGVSEHPPPHPPLPQRSYTSPFIMHKLFGTPAPPPRLGEDQFSLQTPGAGPSRQHDPEQPAEEDSASGQGTQTS